MDRRATSNERRRKSSSNSEAVIVEGLSMELACYVSCRRQLRQASGSMPRHAPPDFGASTARRTLPPDSAEIGVPGVRVLILYSPILRSALLRDAARLSHQPRLANG